MTFAEMELTLDVCSEMCPSCRSVNLFPGFSAMMAYTCQHCGEVVRISGDADGARFFGPADDR